ncbi:N-acetylmuramoyl-L-alanine amidase LytC precursor [Clostridium ragsdalei P11]|uniref:N-acetylmuramoyl-L-alanine amidase LytC n=1 Tax=Clostridium ragsdalei P11 TaxID=1353534 RepID=A0A1A6AL41_9CLOT|nr:cell wall-binding repeat-containing protein [Clostridium ragsdalei]OBR90771.1 N-acetylmuramoyl-L-alanine amidase LytC precursor [Clostridium ragsdalei P11]
MDLVKFKPRKILTCIIILFILFGIKEMVNPFKVSAKTESSAVADSLTIRVTDSNGSFKVAKVFTDSDFSSAVNQSYSFMDSMPSPGMDAAIGLPLSDLLSKSNINLDDVQSLEFYTTDVSGRPYKTMKKSFLYSTRYYYPHIMEYWDAGTQSFTDNDKAVSDKEIVEPMIAVSDNWVRGAMKPDFSTQAHDQKYRLLMGQTSDPTEITAFNSAKWIYQIDVTLASTTPVANVPVTGVTLNKNSTTILAGNTERLIAAVDPSNVTNSDVTWSSDDSSVAKVDNNGLVTAVSKGTTTITVRTKDGGKTAECNVTVDGGGTTPVISVPVTGVILNKNSTTILNGSIEQLTATVSPNDATDKDVTWSSSDSSVAKVNKNGLVTAVGEGTATITVKTEDGAKTAECDVTVNESETPVQPAVKRLFGQSRIDTAIAIAKATYPNKISNVILTASDNYPDALAGSVLAYKLKAPILLVGRNNEDQEKIIDYMKSNMDPLGTVYILGGNGSVSKDMEARANEAGFKNINRIGGADRYQTAVKISDTVGAKEGTPLVIVSGKSYPDALSVSSAAAVKQYPILMVEKDEIPDAIKKEISILKPSKVFIIGLQGAVSTEVEDQLSQIAAIDKTNIVRIGGENRFETSLEVAKYFNLSGSKVCVSSGNNFPDALAGSSYAANNNAPIILCNTALSDDIMNYLKTKNISEGTIFGGESVISKEVGEELLELTTK